MKAEERSPVEDHKLRTCHRRIHTAASCSSSELSYLDTGIRTGLNQISSHASSMMLLYHTQVVRAGLDSV